jgi:membrane fusion protein, hemolysin D
MSKAHTNAQVIPLRRRAFRRDELEFLPAALEIIETPASPAGRTIAGAIILFLCIGLGWSVIGHVDIIATAPGRVIPTGKTKLIQPLETGVVRKIHVGDGATVSEGDVLVEMDPTANEADETRLKRDLAQDRLDIARLTALLAGDPDRFLSPEGADEGLSATARRQMEEQSAEQEAKLAGLDRQIAQKRAEAAEVSASIGKIEATLPIVKGQRDIREAAMKVEFGSRLMFLQAEQQYVELQHDLLVQQRRREETTEAISVLERQRVQAVAEYRKSLLADLAKARAQANEHGEEARKAAQKRELQTLRAPVDGTVQQLGVHTVGGVVTPAQLLMVIVPRDAHLEIEATLPNKDIGFVHAGQPVEVKVETFNFTRYGLIHGTVASVSRDVVAPDINVGDARTGRGPDAEIPKDEQERQSRQPAYVAHITLAETTIDTEQGMTALEPGMAVTAEIKTGERRVIEYLLSPLLRYRHEAIRER